MMAPKGESCQRKGVSRKYNFNQKRALVVRAVCHAVLKSTAFETRQFWVLKLALL